ncbi:MAG: SIR2 family NAD-dependent protein deacylase [Actinomycetota bacterium]
MTDREPTIEDVAGWMSALRRITVLTGAGISTDSGIPDFRGPQGLWTTNPGAEKLFSFQNYMNDPAVRKLAWKSRLEHPAWDAKPGPGHLALADLEKAGMVHTLITQNIDGLHQAAGTSDRVIIEIHGTLRNVVCMSCDDLAPMEHALERVRTGDDDPRCRTCGGILKSATISFGQNLVAEDLLRAQEAASDCEVFLAVGTSLTVAPVSYLPWIAVNAGARLVIINAEATPCDAVAAAVFHEPIGAILPRLAELVKATTPRQ